MASFETRQQLGRGGNLGSGKAERLKRDEEVMRDSSSSPHFAHEITYFAGSAGPVYSKRVPSFGSPAGVQSIPSPCLSNRVIELGGESGTETEPHIYPGTYVEYVARTGHEAPGVHN